MYNEEQPRRGTRINQNNETMPAVEYIKTPRKYSINVNRNGISKQHFHQTLCTYYYVDENNAMYGKRKGMKKDHGDGSYYCITCGSDVEPKSCKCTAKSIEINFDHPQNDCNMISFRNLLMPEVPVLQKILQRRECCDDQPVAVKMKNKSCGNRECKLHHAKKVSESKLQLCNKCGAYPYRCSNAVKLNGNLMNSVDKQKVGKNPGQRNNRCACDVGTSGSSHKPRTVNKKCHAKCRGDADQYRQDFKTPRKRRPGTEIKLSNKHEIEKEKKENTLRKCHCNLGMFSNDCKEFVGKRDKSVESQNCRIQCCPPTPTQRLLNLIQLKHASNNKKRRQNRVLISSNKPYSTSKCAPAAYFEPRQVNKQPEQRTSWVSRICQSIRDLTKSLRHKRQCRRYDIESYENQSMKVMVDHNSMNVRNKQEVYRSIIDSGLHRPRRDLPCSCKSPSCAVNAFRTPLSNPPIEMVVDSHTLGVKNKVDMLHNLKKQTKRHTRSQPYRQPTLPSSVVNRDCTGLVNTKRSRHSMISTILANESPKGPCQARQRAQTQRMHGHPKGCRCCDCNNSGGPRKLTMAESMRFITDSFKPKKKVCVCGAGKLDPDSTIVISSEDGLIVKCLNAMLNLFGKGPCNCGSRICDFEKVKMKQDQEWDKKLRNVKPCTCGSHICDKVATKSRRRRRVRRRQNTKKQSSKTSHPKIITPEKAESIRKTLIERRKRLSRYAREDKIARKKWKLKEKKRLKEVERYKNAEPGVLVTESLVDIVKFGWSSLRGLAKTSYRLTRNPGDAVHKLKQVKENPRRAAKKCWKSVRKSKAADASYRIKRRISLMPVTKRLIYGLEKLPITNYLVHLWDKDPRKRMRRVKPLKEPRGGDCSLYLTSLRRKPCLWVYYVCPWFYPHCIGMLSVWRQFTDFCLFILAIVVWSPCIIFTELCRGLLCCLSCPV